MSNKLIRSLLQGRLNAWATAKPIPVAWDNVKFCLLYTSPSPRD